MDTFTSLVDKFANSLYNLLPTSPFRPYINKLASLKFLPYLNWFVPVGTLVAIATAWISVIGLYYLYQLLLRWVKMIE